MSSDPTQSGPRPPSVDALARSLDSEIPERIRLRAARQTLADGRATGDWAKSGDEWVELASSRARHLAKPRLSPVINGTGIILHTGLGRARLADAAVDAVRAMAGSHADVEVDRDTGQRGDRQLVVRWLLQELTGAASSLVVNNCAAATMLSLAALAPGRPVILSRGEMVEIGGAFRMPEIVSGSGCQLVEVGCTNKTHLRDYEEAMDVAGEPGVILRCHQSNFVQEGFVSRPSTTELVSLAQKSGWVFVDDLGSGCLVDTTRYGLPKERTLREALAEGADLVLASGDKLLGGPQSGLILGREDLVSKCAKHPLARATRIDKLDLAALEATLRLYLEAKEAEIPTWWACGRSLGELIDACEQLARAWGGESRIEPGHSELGGGSLPTAGIPTMRIGLIGKATAIYEQLWDAGLLSRIESGTVWIDPRAISDDEMPRVQAILGSIQP
ncbi:MAG: L-seryl-tRNA(Sec) selenium transferase [Armatimonadetes bacterium]|nr:L-seryl-tRNA(Sec) selenium transferase [Armatimonadota bacterium]